MNSTKYYQGILQVQGNAEEQLGFVKAHEEMDEEQLVGNSWRGFLKTLKSLEKEQFLDERDRLGIIEIGDDEDTLEKAYEKIISFCEKEVKRIESNSLIDDELLLITSKIKMKGTLFANNLVIGEIRENVVAKIQITGTNDFGYFTSVSVKIINKESGVVDEQWFSFSQYSGSDRVYIRYCNGGLVWNNRPIREFERERIAEDIAKYISLFADKEEGK